MNGSVQGTATTLLPAPSPAIWLLRFSLRRARRLSQLASALENISSRLCHQQSHCLIKTRVKLCHPYLAHSNAARRSKVHRTHFLLAQFVMVPFLPLHHTHTKAPCLTPQFLCASPHPRRLIRPCSGRCFEPGATPSRRQCRPHSGTYLRHDAFFSYNPSLGNRQGPAARRLNDSFTALLFVLNSSSALGLCAIRHWPTTP